MKLSTTVLKSLIVILICTPCLISKANYWTTKANYPSSTHGNIYFSIEGKGYVGAGESLTYPKKDFWQYDPITNIWTQKADYGGGWMWAGCSFAIGTLGYAGLGMDQFYNLKRDFWEYNPFTNMWKKMVDFPASARTHPTFFAANGKGYVGMGADSIFNLYNDLWEFDPSTNMWTQKTSLPSMAVQATSSFVIDTIAYVVGGSNINNQLAQLWEYNTLTDTWVQNSNFPFIARDLGMAFSLCQKGYFGTGNDGNGLIYLNDLWQYDPVSGAWTQKTSFPGAGRCGSACFTIGNKAYVGNGANHFTIFNDFYEYTPDSLCLTSLNDGKDINNLIVLYPNPVFGSATVILNIELLHENVILKITDLKGKTWRQVNYSNVFSEIKFDINNLAPGIYLLQLQSGELNGVKKFVVQ
jgi:N-acetylneuraminic acid mutarotase